MQDYLNYLLCQCDGTPFYSCEGFDPTIRSFGSCWKRCAIIVYYLWNWLQILGYLFPFGAHSERFELFPPVYNAFGCLVGEVTEIRFKSLLEILALNPLVTS